MKKLLYSGRYEWCLEKFNKKLNKKCSTCKNKMKKGEYVISASGNDVIKKDQRHIFCLLGKELSIYDWKQKCLLELKKIIKNKKYKELRKQYCAEIL